MNFTICLFFDIALLFLQRRIDRSGSSDSPLLLHDLRKFKSLLICE